MSLNFNTWKKIAETEKRYEYVVHDECELSQNALVWMKLNGKDYSLSTLNKFDVHEGRIDCIDIKTGRKKYQNEPVIIIPAKLFKRLYRFHQRDKKYRWLCAPTGQPASLIGDLSYPEILLVEGEWDMLRLHSAGFPNAVTGTTGAGAFQKHWIPLFTNKKVIICYDQDVPGLKGAGRTAELLSGTAKEIYFIDLPLRGTPDEKDVSDFFRIGHTASDFERLLGQGRRHV